MKDGSWTISEVDTKSAPADVLIEAAELSVTLDRELHRVSDIDAGHLDGRATGSFADRPR